VKEKVRERGDRENGRTAREGGRGERQGEARVGRETGRGEKGEERQKSGRGGRETEERERGEREREGEGERRRGRERERKQSKTMTTIRDSKRHWVRIQLGRSYRKRTHGPVCTERSQIWQYSEDQIICSTKAAWVDYPASLPTVAVRTVLSTRKGRKRFGLAFH